MYKPEHILRLSAASFLSSLETALMRERGVISEDVACRIYDTVLDSMLDDVKSLAESEREVDNELFIPDVNS